MKYYQKYRSRLKDAINELIVYKLASKIDIVCPKITIEKAKSYYYKILSENLENLGDFKIANYYLMPEYRNNRFYISLYAIWHSLEKSFDNVYEIMKDVIKIYFLFLIMIVIVKIGEF